MPDQAAVHQALRSSNPIVRLQAAWVAGRLQDPAYLPELKDLRDDPLAGWTALFALGQIEGGEAYLLDRSEPIALAGLGKRGGAAALPVLERALPEPAAAQALGVYALRRTRGQNQLPPVPEGTLAKLRALAEDRRPEVRRASLYALYRCADAGAEPVLVRLLGGDEPELALRALSSFQHRATESVVAFQNSPNWVARYWAVRALLQSAPERLLGWLDDPNPHIRRAVLSGLPRAPKTWWEALERASRDAEPGVAEAALRLLPDHHPRLQEALQSQRWRERRAAAVRYPGLLLNDPDPRVREAALRSTSEEEPLRQALRERDPMLAVAAATRLAELSKAELAPEIRLALEHFLKTGQSEPAQDLLKPLVQLGQPDWVRPLLDGPDHNLGVAAARALGVAAPPGLPGAGPRPAEPLTEPPETEAWLHTNRGSIHLRLYPEQAPATVTAFCRRARGGFYRGLTFHRVVSDFVVQTGCPRGDGWGGQETLPCELTHLPYGRGTVGMALAGKDTGSTQFFICHSPQPHLDGGYTVFAQVEEGLEVVDLIQEEDELLNVEIGDE